MNAIPPQSSSSSPKAEDAEVGRRLHEAQEEKGDSSSEGEDEEERKQRQEEMMVKSFDNVRPNPISRHRLKETCASKGGCSADEEVNTEHHNTKIYRKSLTSHLRIFDFRYVLLSVVS